MILSGIDCVLNGEKAVYCSTELTTGTRLYGALREHKCKNTADLRATMGEAWFKNTIVDANARSANQFARQVRALLRGTELVVTPAPFAAPGWSQPQYLAFWETFLRTRVKCVWFEKDWQFSNGCVLEFATAHDVKLPALDHSGNALGLGQATQLIESAIQQLKNDGFDAAELSREFAALRQS